MANEPRAPGPADQPALWEALARHVAGESPAAEADAIDRWLAGDPARAGVLEALRRASDGLAHSAPADLDVEAALRRVKARIEEGEVRVLPIEPARGAVRERAPIRWRTIGLRVAASLVLLLGAGAVWQSVREHRPGALQGVAATTWSAPTGQTESVNLPDGTRVLLGPGSRLSVPAAYNVARRDVELAGDAQFDVVHDEGRPFTVRAGAAVIQDLGTSFVVRSDGASEVRVVVTSGSVLLHASGAPAESGVILHAGDRGVLGAAGSASAERAAAIDADLAWTRGRLVFQDTPLARVADALHRWYGIELRLADPALAGRHLTATFEGETAREVLDIIALTLGTRIELRGDTALMSAAAVR